MDRPALARILVDRAAEAGAKVRFGASCARIDQDGDGVLVTFADGGSARYDLVVGADGVRSPTRALLGIDAGTRATGMGIWRAFTPRPPSVTRTDLYYGGPCYIAGYCPTGADTMYAYLVEDAQDRSGLTRVRRRDQPGRRRRADHGPVPDHPRRERQADPDGLRAPVA